jgi:hypothetical protein
MEEEIIIAADSLIEEENAIVANSQIGERLWFKELFFSERS